MTMTDLIPWKKSNDSLARRQGGTDPFMQLRQEVNEMFNGMLGDWTGRMPLFSRGGQTFMPHIEMKENAKEIRVTAELPGLEEKDLQVSLLGGAIVIKGEKREEHEEEAGDLCTSERQYGVFERTIPLPTEVDAEKIKASFKKGVLKVTLPKTKEAQSNLRLIPVET